MGSLQPSHKETIQCPYNLSLLTICPNRRKLHTLEQAVEQADRQTFALLATTIDWSLHGATDLTRAIDLALALDMVSLARELAHQGGKIFPEDKRLQQAMAVLAPPVVRGTR